MDMIRQNTPITNVVVHPTANNTCHAVYGVYNMTKKCSIGFNCMFANVIEESPGLASDVNIYQLDLVYKF